MGFLSLFLSYLSSTIVVLKNTGSTTVTYEWKKIERGDHIPAKNSDGVQRFYCHYPRDTLKPGEAKTFIFSFRSEKPGMFNEEWELLTEPQLLEAAPVLNLSGMATQGDAYIEKRKTLNERFDEELVAAESADIVDDAVGEARTPPQPEASSSKLNSQKFEQVNEHLGLHYTKANCENFNMLYQLVVHRLQRQGSNEAIEAFTGEVEYIEELITRVQNPYTQESLQQRYVHLFYQAKKLPVDRAQSFDIFKAMIKNFAEDVVEFDEKARQEIGMIENLGFEAVPEDQTEEQAAEYLEELKLKKAEALKKSKQKPKTDEEESAETE